MGDVTLDGVDFDIEAGGDSYWHVLAEELHSYREQRKFSLSAAPQCPINVNNLLDKAIKTGHFDYVWVQFYNNPSCQYNYNETPHTKGFLDAWVAWTTTYKTTYKFFVGLPASPSANGSAGGYVKINDLNNDLIPKVQGDPKFGGIMLWDRYHDIPDNYSGQIKCAVSAAFGAVHEALADMMKSASEVLYRLSSQF